MQPDPSSPRRLTSLLALGFALSPSLSGCGDDSPATDASTESGATEDSGDGPEGGSESDTGDPEPDPEVVWPTLDCDPLVPEHCAYPYPNNVYSHEDPETETGRRLAFSPTFMPEGAGHQPSPDAWHLSDGFSPASTMLAYLPGATVTGLPTPVTIADSLAADSPTILLDAETGDRIPHWAELDMSHANDERRTFMIRPVVRLEPDRRYIVAIRNVVDDAGVALEPSPAFEALRDVGSSEDLDPAAADSVEQRRPLYADIFARLADADVERHNLQLAWDFTTASDANITARLVHMRDVGLDLFEADPAWSIVEVEVAPNPGIALKVTGVITVPLFLDSPEPGGRMTLGADGLPEALTTADFPFTVLIPESAYFEPARLVQFGHGLFGAHDDVDGGLMRGFAVDYNIITFASTWIGLSGEDIGHIATLLSTGRLDDFDTIPDRLAQGVVNGLVLMRLLETSFADAPELLGSTGPGPNNVGPPLLDLDQVYYFGGSLGGIMGAVYMALTTDVERGVLAVPGQPFSLLLNRSEAFEQLAPLAQAAYLDTLDLRFSLELMQQLWDRAEPSGYTRHITNDPLPGTDVHEVLVLDAMGDHLVTTLSAHVMVRELGIPQLAPANRDLFGIEAVDQPWQGSAMIEYDFGLPPEPLTNVPMSQGSDPHSALTGVPIAVQTAEQFLRLGTVESFCDGLCDPD